VSARDPSMYQRHPDLSRYTGGGRYENPKEDFKTIADKLAGLRAGDTAHTVADIGCANGELLYHLHQRFPCWVLHGYDHTAEFIETARAVPELSDMRFRRADLFEIDEQYDVVIATCFLSLFREIEPPVHKLVDLCKPGGLVLATGLFNPFDIYVRVEFCDNSRPETAGQWRSDFNRHPQRRLRETLGDRVARVEFEPCRYGVDLPRDPDRPIRVWTLRDEKGETWLINGAGQIINQTLMTIHK